MPTIPSSDHSLHVNFPEIVTDETSERLLSELSDFWADPHAQPNAIVLNFEKSRWFDILPLARTAALIIRHHEMGRPLHIVGPSTSPLPYMYDYVRGLQARLEAQHEGEERDRLIRQIDRHTKVYPELRQRAGAFLAAWGFMDAVEDYYPNCTWYLQRDRSVPFGVLKTSYGHVFGANAIAPDRVRRLSLVSRLDQLHTLDQLNSEELIAGPLSSFAALEIFRSGLAPNVLFFEPFENVFQHAYRPSRPDDYAVFAMRILKPGYPDRSPGKSLRKNFLEEHADVPVFEIVIADAGIGIPLTLSKRRALDVTYRPLTDEHPSESRDAWETLRYAFEDHSTQKSPPPPGVRGLSWLKRLLLASQGYVRIASDCAMYEAGTLASTSKENVYSGPRPKIAGTALQVLFPLQRIDAPPLLRHVAWTPPDLQFGLFDGPAKAIYPARLPSHLLTDQAASAWMPVLDKIASISRDQAAEIVAIDLGQGHATRAALESLLTALSEHDWLRGRVIVVNCNRHIATRIGTVSAVAHLERERVLVPLLTPTLQIYFLGATANEESTLLQSFGRGTRPAESVRDIAARNAALFNWHGEMPTSLAFSIVDIERAARSSLGAELFEMLEQTGNVHRGRIQLPFGSRTTTTYVEPHQLFGDEALARRVCEHIALLLRSRFAKRVGIRSRRLSVLTATRIGREFAARMPDAYPRRAFVFFDPYLDRPDKPRLLKKLIQQHAVIVVDVVSTGEQVRKLINACSFADSTVLGVISLLDFSPGDTSSTMAFEQNGTPIDHFTFYREPQVLSKPEPGDQRVHPESLTLVRHSEPEEDASEPVASVAGYESLRLLEDAGAVRPGHYEMYSRHFEFVVETSRLAHESSPVRSDILREFERQIIERGPSTPPVAIVIYPDTSDIHLLRPQLVRRPRVQRLMTEGGLRFLEARRGMRARGRRFWLSEKQVGDTVEWASKMYPNGYSVLIFDEAASSGQTLLAMMEAARRLRPSGVRSFVLINRMTHLQTRHHRDIERFKWAESSFSSYLHLNIQAYSLDTCPTCRERNELMRDIREARTEWFASSLRDKLRRLELRTTFDAGERHDDPPSDVEFEMRNAPDQAINLPWEPLGLRRSDRSRLGYILSARVALNSGVPVREVMTAFGGDIDDVIWGETFREISRRSDLLHSQHVEEDVADILIQTLRDRDSSVRRRVLALELLRMMRREAILPRTKDIVAAALGRILDHGMAAELALFIKRVLEYRHVPPSTMFDRKIMIQRLLEESTSGSQRSRDRATRRVLEEFSDSFVHPATELPRIVRALERLLRTHGRVHHQLITEIRTYVAQGTFEPDPASDVAVDNVLLAAFLGKQLINGLGDHLHDDSLITRSIDAYAHAQSLRRLIRVRRQRPTVDMSILRDGLEDMHEYLVSLGVELQSQIVDPVPLVQSAITTLKRDNAGADRVVSISFESEPELGMIIIDSGLFGQIVAGIVGNLGKHAVDDVSREVSANITLSRFDDEYRDKVVLSVDCKTRGTQEVPADLGDTTLARHAIDAASYGVSRVVAPEPTVNADAPWREQWSFWRL